MRCPKFRNLPIGVLLLLLLSFVSPVYATSEAFPPTYVPGGPGAVAAYNALLAAKIAWLTRRVAAERDLLGQAKVAAKSRDDRLREVAEQKVDEYTDAVKKDNADLAVLGAAKGPAQVALLRKNVQDWIAALATEIRQFETNAETAAQKAEAANSKKEAGWRRQEEADAKAAATVDRTEKADLEKDATAAGLLP